MILFLQETNLDSNIVDDEILHINSILNNQLTLKKLLMSYMEKITVAVNIIENPIDIKAIHECLENLKGNLDNLNDLISIYNILLDTLQTFKNNIDTISAKITDYNSSYKEISDKCLKVNNEIFYFLNDLLSYISIVFPEEPLQKVSSINIQENNIENCSDLEENCLIISEKNQNVILPYTILDLQKTLEENPKDYNSIQDIIEK